MKPIFRRAAQASLPAALSLCLIACGANRSVGAAPNMADAQSAGAPGEAVTVARAESMEDDGDEEMADAKLAAPAPPAAFRQDRRLSKRAPSPPPPPPPGGMTKPAPKPGPAAIVDQKAMLIYRAQLRLAAFHVKEQIDKVEALAKSLGGYLANRTDTSITIRVPVARFQTALNQSAAMGDELHRDVTVEDVSERYRNLRVRLENAQAVRRRLQKLLERADKVKDALAVQRELARVTLEIERIQGKMRFLKDRAMFSTITVRFSPKRSESGRKLRREFPFPWLHNMGLPRLMNLH